MPRPIVVYGATHCEDTHRTHEYFTAAGIPFREVNIDHDPEAERFLIFINNGQRITPTLVIGDGRDKRVVTEPSDEELAELLASEGYTTS